MQQQNAIITQEEIAIEGVKRLMNIVIGLSNDVFKEGVDFGAIPGTGDKPVLLQPGMEKLLRALHLRAEYVERSKIEDFDKALFFYRYECRLIDWETGICVGTAIGSANSHESKWRWRNAERVCPTCGKSTIIKGKEEFGGGWLCFAKKGGCGAKFKDNDAAITAQQVGRVENPDIFDLMNTCDKIAQKRALGSAIKTVANVSMLYTVDLEDFTPYEMRPTTGADVVEGTFTEVGGKIAPAPATGAGTPPLASAAPTNTGAPQDGSSAKDELFPPPSEDYVTVALPVLGKLNMQALGKRAYDEGLVKGRNHWGNLINKMKDEQRLSEEMTADEVIEAIKRREAEKDVAKEGAS